MAELIAERVAQRIKDLGLTQSEVGELAGMSQPTIGRFANGEVTKTARMIELAKALQTTPDYLTGETDDAGPIRAAEEQSPFHGAPQPGSGGRLLPRDKLAKAKSARMTTAEDMVEIAEIDLRFGLGAAFMDQDIVEHQAERRLFPRAWIRQITTSQPSKLCWAQGRGNSMEPLISDGDLVLIDRSEITPGFGDLYWAIAYGQTGMIKRLRPMPDGSVKILSDNPSVPPETAYDGELNIFGRVVAVVKKV